MTIVASNSLTLSNVNDGTITHTAYSYSADGTDRFTTNYPNLNLLEGSNSNDKSWVLSGSGVYTVQYVPFNSGYKYTFTYTRASTDFAVYMFSGLKKDKFKPDTDYVLSFMANVTTDIKPHVLFANAPGLHNFVNQVNNPTILSSKGDQKVVIQLRTSSSIPSESDQQLYIDGFVNKVGTFSIWDLKIDPGATATPHMPSASEVTTADWPKYRGEYSDMSSEQSTNPSDYTWSLIRGDDGKPGANGHDGIAGKDGTSGIIVSSVAPASPQNGQLWQDTSTTPQLVKKWTGGSWVIWEFYAQNLKADSLSALSADLGDITGGTVKLMDDNWIINGKPKMYGIYQSKFGLLSSGPIFDTSAIVSNTQMSVASLNKGELRFMATDYTEDLKNLQESGMSDQNNAFIKFNSYENGKDIMTIGSSGDIVFKGNTSQDTPWVTLSSGVKYKFMFSRMYISVNVVGDGGSFMQFGTLPQNLRPISDQFLIIANQGAGTADDRHIMVRASDGAVVLWTPKSGITYRGEVSFTL